MSLQLGDRVVYAADPLRYGVMRVGVRTADGRIVCEQCHPSIPPAKRRTEIFPARELAPYTGELVDVHAEAARLEELDTQRAQDADADARSSVDPDEGKGRE